ncbi:hypothetical protein H5410_040328 [Solanum commersonii]|uniref:Uncharacterized protein n=1 Tax=Solanum commersonii TaxID=4109 RepID=A0A9J5XS69_SOLCO|nr:hypothetical protein H5410_040328 [Solanum commersonii]
MIYSVNLKIRLFEETFQSGDKTLKKLKIIDPPMRAPLRSARDGRIRYLEFEAKHGHYLAKRNKMAEKTKKRRTEDCLMH